MRELAAEELKRVSGGLECIGDYESGFDGGWADSGFGIGSMPDDSEALSISATQISANLDQAASQFVPMAAVAFDNSAAACQLGLSQSMADMAGVQRALANWPTLQTAADNAHIDASLLAAVALRETDFQNISQIGGGQGQGVFQIDIGAHPDVTSAQAFDIGWAAQYAANMLAANLQDIQSQFPQLTRDQLMQATAAAYNFGVSNISGDPSRIDIGTTRGNYGTSVLNLQRCF